MCTLYSKYGVLWIFLGAFFSGFSLEIIQVWFHSWVWIYAGNQFLHFEPKFFRAQLLQQNIHNCACILCAIGLSYRLHNQSQSDFSNASDCLMGMRWSMISVCSRTPPPHQMMMMTIQFKDLSDLTIWFAQDHIAEVLEKWDNIDDEIWAKVFSSLCPSNISSSFHILLINIYGEIWAKVFLSNIT